jgi:hypothetical protein
MKRVLLSLALFAMVGFVKADIPLVNATCPGGIDVHADEGGPIYINGEEGKLKTLNENSYEAIGQGITISLSIDRDGTPSVSYSSKDGAKGVCGLTED